MVVTARVPPGHLMPCHNVWDGEVCRCLTLTPVVMPPVQAAWVAPNQHLERRMMADGGRNSVLHPLNFLNTDLIQVEFLWTQGVTACCSVLVHGFCHSGKQWQCKQPVPYSFLGVSLWGNMQVLIQTVPGILLCAKRPSSHTVQNILFGFGSCVLSMNILTLNSNFVQSYGKSLEMWVLTYRIHWQQVP